MPALRRLLRKLLLGLLKPSEGRICIGGYDLHKVGPRNVRAIVGAVMQDDQLFAGSIADNIAFADDEADLGRIEKAILAGPEAERIIHMKTLYLGPDELLVAAKIGFHADQRLQEVATAVNVIERRVRDAVPAARVIYLEPDLYIDPNLQAPPTDAIVIKGLE